VLDGVFSEADVVRIAPFEEVGVELARLWFSKA